MSQEDLDRVKESLALANEIIIKGLERVKDIDLDITRSLVQEQSLRKEKETLKSKISFFQDEMNNIRDSLARINKENEDFY